MKKKQQKAAPTKPAVTPPVVAPPAPAPLSLSQMVILLALLLLLAGVPYLNTLSNEFTLDDFPIIVENQVLRDLRNSGKIFTSKYWSEKDTGLDRGLYRPFTVFTYALNYAFTELRPRSYHVVNLVLHIGSTLLLFMLARVILGSAIGAFITASIFAVHPVHSEAVTSIVGRAELLAALFFLLAFWFGRPQTVPCLGPVRQPPRVPTRAMIGWGAAAVFYVLGLLSKEVAITLPALLLVYDWTRAEESFTIPEKGKPGKAPNPGLKLWRYVGFGMVLLVYLPWRSHIVGATQAVWSGWVGVSTDERMLTASRVLMEYLALLVFPRTLNADYWKAEVPIAESAGEPLVLLSMMLWLGLAVGAVYTWRKSRLLFFCLAWFFITILPVSNILFASGHGKAERILYLPSAGFCLFIGGLYGLLQKKVRQEWLLLLALFPLLLFSTLRTYHRNADWKNNFSLALATLKVSPTSPLFNQIAATEYRKRGESDKATSLLQVAIGERPEEYSYHYNLGNAHLSQKRFDQAIAAYQEALRRRPGNFDALNNLGQAQMQAGMNAEAVTTFTQLLSINRNYLAAYLNLGTAYLNMKKLAEAATVFQDGLKVFPNNGGLHFNLAVVLNQMGQAQEAEQAYQKAIASDPSFKNLKYK